MQARHALRPDPQALYAAALAYAARGWHVFPLRPGTKQPAVPRHPAHRCDLTDPTCGTAGRHLGWEERASIDPDQIGRWWSGRDRYGIGIATGPSRLVAIDLDTAKTPGARSGIDTITALAARAGTPIATTHTVVTPSGGRHLYFTAPPHGPALGCTAGRLGPGVDTRATGGYVVAPPTVTPTGLYRTAIDMAPASLPGWLATALNPPPPRQSTGRHWPARPGGRGRLARYVAAAVNAETSRVASKPVGERSVTLFVAAKSLGQLVGAGALTADDATTALLGACEGHYGVEHFTESDARATIASGLRQGTAKPRPLPNFTEHKAQR